ncbi:MAG: hypothetical protein E7658_02250 [Ruminococcaceae bacterium]|nr:hypothetical protein [Oscillospiraceae bacterium]
MKSIKIILFALLLGALLLVGCGETTVDETDTTAAETVETEAVTEAETEPVLTPSAHQISIEDVESILKANEMSLTHSTPYAEPACHGGQQMRICRTERGDYVAFVKNWVDTDNSSVATRTEFYIAKITPDNEVALLYFDTLDPTASTVHLNIGQDTNGDIFVIATGNKTLATYILDAETDAVSTCRETPIFNSGYALGYSSAMFDFENRKIYAFCNGNPAKNTQESADYVMEWFVFDLESMRWNPEGVYHIFEKLGRHTFVFPFPDGNGGAYIVGERNNYLAPLTDLIVSPVTNLRTFDELRMFHIPDLTSSENITHTTIQEVYSERGQEGVWSIAANNQDGGVFVDADGYMHITYLFHKYDLGGNCPDLDPDYQYRHAIYDGMECIFNEQIEMPVEMPAEDPARQYRPQIRQDTDGTLYMIIFGERVIPMEIYIYKANDPLGKTWTLMNTHTFDDVSSFSSSISAPRNGSLQDDVLSCFFYTRDPSPRTVYTFHISLADGSVSELQNILADTDLIIDEYYKYNAYSDAHTHQIVHTENGTYAAFVYKYVHDRYSVYDCTEYFCIAKIHEDNSASILYTGSYQSFKDKYLTIKQLGDGKIYVFPPHGTEVYCIDPAADTVTANTITLNYSPWENVLQQIDVFTNEETGKTHVLSINGFLMPQETPGMISVSANTMTLESLEFSKRARLSMFSVDEGYYTNFYSFPDGEKGVYLVASHVVDPHTLADGPDYVGRTINLKDSISLFHIPDLNRIGTMETVVIQAPYTDEKADGIWSVAEMGNTGDAFMDADGKLHVFYTYYQVDLDDMDVHDNAERIANTTKHYHAVYNGLELVSVEELAVDGLTEKSAIRAVTTTDDTLYLLICNIGEEGAKIDVYFETANGWALTQTKTLGEFTAESFCISGHRGTYVQDNVIDCLIYANDNDVYYTGVTFE